MKIVLIGMPGSGKGSQAELISEKFKLKHIALGDILREEIRKRTKLGLMIKRVIGKGHLIKDYIAVSLIKKLIKNKNNFLLDGFPRDLAETKALGKIAKIDYVFFLDVKKSTIIKRLSNRRVCGCGESYNLISKKPKKDMLCSCGKKLYQREDDKPEAIKERLKVYNKKTKPVVDYYKKNDLLIKINGERDIKQVFNEISRYLK